MVQMQHQPQHPGIDSSMNAQQVYLQQQHAALQQQQLLLQQQQAALALQQQQLQAYGMNPVMLNTNTAANPGGIALNGWQMGAPGVGGGFIYVSAADGTPMLMAANPGMMGHQGQQPMMTAQQMSAPLPGGILGQSPGGINMNGMMTQQQINIPGMMALPPGGFPGMVGASSGMMAMNPQNGSSNNNGNMYSNQPTGHNQFQQQR